MRRAIPAKIRLQVTLQYLSGPASFTVLEDIFRIPKPTLSKIIPEVCEAIWEEFNQEVIILPKTKEGWKEKADEFRDLWQYPFALAAIDGKHIQVQAFKQSGLAILYADLVQHHCNLFTKSGFENKCQLEVNK